MRRQTESASDTSVAAFVSIVGARTRSRHRLAHQYRYTSRQTAHEAPQAEMQRWPIPIPSSLAAALFPA
jgi:hypothetical protein